MREGGLGVLSRYGWLTLTMAIVFLFLLWANIETPFWADDYCRMNIGDWRHIVASAWHDYFVWTGRSIVTVITTVVIESGRTWSMIPFDVANAAIFVALIRLVLALARMAAGPVARPTGGPLAGALDVAVVALLLWWLPRTIAEVALWKTGSIGYLWPVAGELLVMRLALDDHRVQRLWPVPFAFVIATFLEPLSLLMSGVLVGHCLRRRGRGLSAPIGLTIAHVAGTLALLAAPGNFVRAATLPPDHMMDRLVGVAGNVGSLFDPIWLLAVAFVAISFAVAPVAGVGHPTRWSGAMSTLQARHGWMFLALAAIYMALLLAVPRASLAARVSFPASVLLVCYLVTVFLRRPVSVRGNRVTGALLVLLAMGHAAIVVPELIYLARIDRAWAADPQLRLGPEADVVLPLVRVHGRIATARKHVFFQGLTPDPGYFTNVCYARAMDVRTVVAR